VEAIKKVTTSVKLKTARWATNLNAILTQWSLSTKKHSPFFDRHFWIVVFLMAAGSFTYYIDRTPLIHFPPFNNNLFTGVHDWQRTLFLIPIIYATVIYNVKGSLISSFIFLLIVFPHGVFFPPYPGEIFGALLFVFISMGVSLLFAFELNRASREHSQLELFLSDTFNSQEEEKQHLARELHDESLQDLVDIAHEIDRLIDTEDRDIRRKNQLQLLRDHIDNVLVRIRQLILGLRPPLLDEMGLVSSLDWLAQEISEEKGIEVNVNVIGVKRRLTDIMELNLFRIAQEALQNAKKHSRANIINLSLVFTSDKVQLKVQDNGIGFAAAVRENLKNTLKFGLVGMSERAKLLGSTLRIESSEGNGTLIYVEIATNRALK
jgi:signal transduction histidine kinase